MDKSVIYVANTANASVVAGGTISLPTTVRRKGCKLAGSGAGVIITNRNRCDDYYDVEVSVTFTAVAAGNVTINLLQDGVQVVGGTASVTVTTAGTQIVTVSFPATIKVSCGNSPDTLTLTASAAITVSNATMQVSEV